MMGACPASIRPGRGWPARARDWRPRWRPGSTFVMQVRGSGHPVELNGQPAALIGVLALQQHPRLLRLRGYRAQRRHTLNLRQPHKAPAHPIHIPGGSGMRLSWIFAALFTERNRRAHSPPQLAAGARPRLP